MAAKAKQWHGVSLILNRSLCLYQWCHVSLILIVRYSLPSLSSSPLPMNWILSGPSNILWSLCKTNNYIVIFPAIEGLAVSEVEAEEGNRLRKSGLTRVTGTHSASSGLYCPPLSLDSFSLSSHFQASCSREECLRVNWLCLKLYWNKVVTSEDSSELGGWVGCQSWIENSCCHPWSLPAVG